MCRSECPIQRPDRALLTLVPHTTSARGTPFEAVVPVRFLKPGAFDVQGLVTVPPPRAVRLLGVLTAEQMQPIENALCSWLALPCEQRGA